MKPTNSKNLPCTQISSNCVTWEGPDVECLGLCKGDTVSDVVAKAGQELCIILDYLDVKNYDLTCLKLTNCNPKTFQELIQLIIDRICTCCNLTPTTPGVDGCPDCVVSIAPCFQYFNPANGDLVTELQLIDYVSLIGIKFCELLDVLKISSSQLTSLTSRVSVLEKKPAPTFTIPQIIPVCVLPSVPTDINIVLQALEQQFCSLQTSTGNPTSIYQAIAKQCVGLNNADRLGGPGIMSSLIGWNNAPLNMADSFGNLWLAYCDARAAINNIQLNCCPTTCAGISVVMQATMASPTAVTLFFNGTIPLGFQECSPAGTMFTIADQSGGFITTTFSVISVLNSPSGFPVNLAATPINTADNLTITATLCLEDNETGSICQSILNFTVVNVSACPVVNFIQNNNSLDFSFTHVTGSVTYVVELWDNGITTLLQSQTIPAPIPQPIIGTFGGLVIGTQYKVRVKVVVGVNTTICPFVPVSTLPNPCPAPINVYVVFEIL